MTILTGAETVKGRVCLIGCGPGDAELLTLKAARRIGVADVLVVDRLVGEGVLALAKPTALVIPVGKVPGGPSVTQDEINRILVREALKGQDVARLKGGDGFVFGRAAEEIAAVRTAGIPVDVIPGITAAHACAASIVLPLTLRESIRQFSLVTGTTSKGELDLDWAALARPGHAFAIYMGVGRASCLAEGLRAAGAPGTLPVIVVENGTLPQEVAVATTLDHLARAIVDFGITGPAIIFGGLSWEDASLSMPAAVKVYAPRPRTAAQISHNVRGVETL